MPKEGPPGPQGPRGPQGPQGESGGTLSLGEIEDYIKTYVTGMTLLLFYFLIIFFLVSLRQCLLLTFRLFFPLPNFI